jgi:hypothetical protein
MLHEVIVPCVDDLLSLLAGFRVRGGTDLLVSRLFSQGMSIARRRRLNAELATCRTQIVEAFPDEDEMRRDARLTLVILGRDALIGTVALSLRAHLEAAGGRLDSLAMPSIPTHTGVPFVDREALVDLDLGHCPIKAGETVRVVLDGFQGMDEAWRMRFFGAGPHVCLGRPLSLLLMDRVSACLVTIETSVSVAQFRLRKDDVFAFPETFTVEIQP